MDSSCVRLTTARKCLPSSSATEKTESISVSGVSVCLAWALRRLTTCWVVAKLPLLSSTSTPWPGCSETVILQKLDTWSRPALVRESEANSMPSSSDIATQ